MALSDNNISSVPSNLVTGRTALTDIYMYDNVIDEMPSLVGLSNMNIISASGNVITSYNYNAFLDSFKAVPSSAGSLYIAPAQYGGCVSNATAGVSAYTTLSTTKGWSISDGGQAACSIV
ncbi:MAG: hypothetical protein LBH46_01575 [Rickettsiales bacterium]|nr:hypothetical protein [Rickettsiales bacterium]